MVIPQEQNWEEFTHQPRGGHGKKFDRFTTNKGNIRVNLFTRPIGGEDGLHTIDRITVEHGAFGKAEYGYNGITIKGKPVPGAKTDIQQLLLERHATKLCPPKVPTSFEFEVLRLESLHVETEDWEYARAADKTPISKITLQGSRYELHHSGKGMPPKEIRIEHSPVQGKFRYDVKNRLLYYHGGTHIDREVVINRQNPRYWQLSDPCRHLAITRNTMIRG